MTDLVNLETGALAFLGGAVARDLEGKVVFVRGAAPGERVEARRIQRRSRFDNAEVVRVLRPSLHRVEPFCPLFGVCGGCEWQHVALAAQRDAGRQIIADALGRAGLKTPVEPVIPSPEDRAWRHRARLHAAPGRDRALLGFFRPGTHEVVDTPECPVLSRPLLDASMELRETLAGQSVRGVAELSLADEGVLAALHLAAAPRNPQELLATLGRSQKISGGVVAWRGGGQRSFGEGTGTKALSFGGGGWRVPVTAGGFLQANWSANALLVERIMDTVGDLAPDGERILELYAGSGNFTLPLLSAGFAVEAWESSGSAARALEGAAERDSQLRVRRGDAARALATDGSTPDLVLLDPPRTGARDVCEVLRDHPVQMVVYVSCDPNTLGRDLGVLGQGGWRLDRVTPVDLFPHTPHVETITVLTRR